MTSKDIYLKSFKTNKDLDKLDKKYSKNLLRSNKQKSGRNNTGSITVRRKGSGHKRLYRIIDFKYNSHNLKIKSIEYDPNRTCLICLVEDLDTQQYSYKLLTNGLNVNDCVNNQEYKVGSFFKLKDIPLGSLLHSVEIKPGKGAQLARSAGSFVKLVQKNSDLNLAKLQLASKKFFYVPLDCFGTVGVLSNIQHKNKNLAKAGRSRWLNRRPKVRGVAMNPVDHPHGGGEGNTSGGRPSVTPWSKITKGKPTRKKKAKLIF